MATTPNYNINYDDKKFQDVETDKNSALDELNGKYDEMINSSDKYYQDQIDASKNWADEQQKLQQDNTNQIIDKIGQEKGQAGKDYTKEQAGSYVDWQKQSGQYGANAEQMASQGLTNSGYSESSQVSMYNTYQNRISTARETYSKAVLNYDNAIKDAQLANNSKLAEIAYQSLQAQLQLSLEGFQYKNQLIMEQMNKQQELDNTYYGRYQDVLNQMNTENAMKEQIRQYEKDYTLKQQQFTEQKRQFQVEYDQKVKEYKESIRQFDTQLAYYKEKDAKEYALKIKQLEEQKRQAQIEQANWEKEYSLKQKQLQQQQSQWQAEYNLAKQKSYSSSSGGSSRSSGGSSSIKKSSSSSSGSSSVNKSSSSSSGTVKLSNGSTGYTSAQKAWANSPKGGAPYSDKYLLSTGIVKQVTSNGKTYYYATK